MTTQWLDRALIERKLAERLPQQKEHFTTISQESAAQTRSSREHSAIRQQLMAMLGVRHYRVETFLDNGFLSGQCHHVRVFTDYDQVQILYMEQPEGRREIMLCVNQDNTKTSLASPTDICGLLYGADVLRDWQSSVERYVINWNGKREQIRQAKAMCIDVDGCLLSSNTGVPTRLDIFTEVVGKLAELKKRGLKIFLNTGRAAIEAHFLLKQMASLGTTINGAVAESGGMIIRGSGEEWGADRNPKINRKDWEAIDFCLNYVRKSYLNKGLAHAEPKVSALTLNLEPDSGLTGEIVAQQLHNQLIDNGLPTTTVDKADVSALGIQLFAGGINKATGMHYLQELLGVTKDQIIAIGDSPGDLPMFEESGVIAIPFNAMPNLWPLADYRSPFIAEEGVLDILNQILEVRGA